MMTVNAELNKFDPRSRPGQKNTRLEANYHNTRAINRVSKVNFVPMQTNSAGLHAVDKNATFGQRRKPTSTLGSRKNSETGTHLRMGAGGAMEMTWTPSTSNVSQGDSIYDDSPGTKRTQKGVEMFGAGMEKGVIGQPELSEMERKGRTQRRKGMRSGSKNVFRTLK
jgi:ribosome biogenesis protein ENP2